MDAVLVPVPEAAMALGIGRTKCFALIADGSLESVLLGGRRLVPAQAIREFAGRLPKSPPPQPGKAAAWRARSTHRGSPRTAEIPNAS